jgi:branched-chain amino acid aminotransferase/4-amino-4-deoxychorismate lyase
MDFGALSHDRGLLLGDGLFETVLAERGQLVLFEAHADRLTRGCALLGLPAPGPDALSAAALAALADAGLTGERAAVRLTWTCGDGGRGLDRPERPTPRLLAAAALAPRPEGAASLSLATVRRHATSPVSRMKSLSYLDNVLARREARARGAEEALMLNTQGELACAAAANLFWLKDGALFTPALDCGVLDGIIRGEVIARAAALGVACAEVHAPLEALDGAEAIVLTNSLIGVRPVSAFAGTEFAPAGLVADLAAGL